MIPFGRMIPGLYEVIQYTLSPSAGVCCVLLAAGARRALASRRGRLRHGAARLGRQLRRRPRPRRPRAPARRPSVQPGSRGERALGAGFQRLDLLEISQSRSRAASLSAAGALRAGALGARVRGHDGRRACQCEAYFQAHPGPAPPGTGAMDAACPLSTGGGRDLSGWYGEGGRGGAPHSALLRPGAGCSAPLRSSSRAPRAQDARW
jgi:hypothetical protein